MENNKSTISNEITFDSMKLSSRTKNKKYDLLEESDSETEELNDKTPVSSEMIYKGMVKLSREVKKIKEDGRKTNEELKEFKSEVSTRLTNIEIRQNNHENNTAQSFNIVHAKFNIQDTRFSFIEDALKEIRGKIEDLGRDRAKNINIKDIVLQPKISRHLILQMI